jgi:hypothetical protein
LDVILLLKVLAIERMINMACKIVRGDNFTAFQCNPGESLLSCGPDGIFDPKGNKPYDDLECRHTRRKEMKGILTCLDCCATYNETTLEWVNNV